MQSAQNTNPNPIQLDKPDVSIMAAVEELQKFFKKKNLLIWFDPDNVSKPNNDHAKALRSFCEVQILQSSLEALDLAEKTQLKCSVIVYEDSGESFVNQIYKKSKISSIYVFRTEKDDLKASWAKGNKKKIHIEEDFQTIVTKIQDWYKSNFLLRHDLPIFSPIFTDDDKTDNNYLQIYLKGLIKFENRSQGKIDFLSLAKNIYLNFKTDINEFEKSYEEYCMEKILNWYTKESFLYRLVNNSLRIAKPDTIYCNRLIVSDLEAAIKEQYHRKSKDFSGVLYRSAYISEEEWTQLQQNCGKDIEMYGFLSASKKPEVIEFFLEGDPDKQVIITVIVPAHAASSESQGFAEIKEFSDLKDEDEVLFNIRSRFAVLETTTIKINKVSYKHLVLLYGKREIHNFINRQGPVLEIETSLEELRCIECKKEEYEKSLMYVNTSNTAQRMCYDCIDKLTSSSNIHSIAAISDFRSTKIEGVTTKYEERLTIPFYGYRCSKCQRIGHNQQFICQSCPQPELKLCKQCFDDKTECLSNQHSFIQETHPYTLLYEEMTELEYIQLHLKYVLENQGDVLYHTNDNSKAKEYFERFLEQNETKDDSKTADIYMKLGEVHRTLAEYEKAIECFGKALEIRKKLHGDNHDVIANLYSCLGLAFCSNGEFSKAKDFYLRALSIYGLLHGLESKQIAACYQKLGGVFEKLNEYAEAKDFFFKACGLSERYYGTKHPKTSKIYNDLGMLCERIGEFSKAEEQHLKVLEINKSLFGSKHPDTASSYNNLGSVYTSIGKLNKAEECHLNALVIKRSVYGEDHPLTATSYSSLGSTYYIMEKYNETMECYSIALKIARSVCGENHPDTATSYNNMGTVCKALGKYDKAKEYLSKALEISRSIHGDKHTQTGIFQNNLGSVYSRLQDFQKAKECYSRGLQILEEVYGRNHHETANCYNNLGIAFEGMGTFQEAIKNHGIALDIMIKIYGKNHHEVACSYTNLGSALYKVQGQGDKALERLLEGLKIFKEIGGDKSQRAAICYDKLGLIHCDKGSFKKAIEYYQLSLKIFQSSYGNKHPETALAFFNLGLAYRRSNQFEKAKDALLNSLKIRDMLSGNSQEDMVNLNNALGYVCSKLNEKEAVEYYSEAIKIRELQFGAQNIAMVGFYNEFGHACCGLGNYKKAKDCYLNGLKINQKNCPKNHPQIGLSFECLGVACFQLQQFKEARDYYYQALEIYSLTYGNQDPKTIIVLQSLQLAMSQCR